jgi:hypothetical protein
LKKLLKITALLASVLLASLLYSCKPEKEGGENEGVIEFDTKAIDQTHPLSGLAPWLPQQFILGNRLPSYCYAALLCHIYSGMG